MKISRNTTKHSTRDLKRIICHVHSQMKRLEGRTAPNWNILRFVIRGTSSARMRGYAYYHGRGRDWDVHLTLPVGVTERRVAWLTYHELMHTYGYKHRQYTDATPAMLALWFPDNAPIKQHVVATKAPRPLQEVRRQRVVVQLAAWETKQKRAANAIKKLRAKVRYYDRAAARKERDDGR